MLEKVNNKQLLVASIVVSAYFLFLFLNESVLRWRYIVIGFVQELFTIPLLLALPIMLFLSIKRSRKDQFSVTKPSLWAFALLLITATVTYGSLVISRL